MSHPSPTRRSSVMLPRAVSIAIAGPTRSDIIRCTNNPWIIRPALVNEKLGVDGNILVKDFEAVGHAVAQADTRYFERLAGPDEPLPKAGPITVKIGRASWRERVGQYV